MLWSVLLWLEIGSSEYGNEFCAFTKCTKFLYWLSNWTLKDSDQWSPILCGLYCGPVRGELSYLAPLGSENISAPYFKQCFFGGGYYPPPQTESNTTPPSPKTEITNILFYILNFASIIKFKM